MPLLQTRATILAGEDTAAFPLWAQKDGRRYEARLVNFEARVSDSVDLEARVKLVRRTEDKDGSNLFGFNLTRIYGGKVAAKKKGDPPTEEDSIDVTNLATRLRARFRDLRAGRFPVAAERTLPIIEYDKTGKKFLVVLPRRSSLSCSDPFLFGNVLGLDLTSLPEAVVATDSGNTLSNTGLETVVIAGRELAPDYLLAAALPGNVAELPAHSGIAAGLLEDVAAATRKVERPHPAAIARALEEAADACLEQLGLAKGLVQVEADESDKEELEIKSVVAAPDTSVLALTFKFSVGTARGHDEMLVPPREIVLDPSKGLAATLTLEEDAADPMEDRYPLSLVCQNYGSADSFIVGRGPQSILALVKEPGHIIRTSRSADFLRSYHLVLSLIDKYFEPVRPNRPVDIFLSFLLKPVVVAQGK
jgi:hypothetical protein